MELNTIFKKNSHKPIYLQLRDRIENYIKENNLSANTRLPGLQTIAREAGVSLKTAERALNELIKENICYRKPKFGTFVTGNKKVSRELSICPIYHRIGENIFNTKALHDIKILEGIQDVCERYSMRTMFLSFKDYMKDINFILRERNMDIEGIIVFNAGRDIMHHVFTIAREFKDIRVVCVNYYYRKDFEVMPENVFGVFNDDFAGSYMMTEFLLSRGYRKIGFINILIKCDNYWERERGYRAALDACKVGIDDTFIVNSFSCKDGDSHFSIGAKSMEILLRAHPDIEAICTVHDGIAFGALEYLKKNYPEKRIKVTGYDNLLPETAFFGNFSTVNVNFVEIGRRAVEIIKKRNKEGFPRILRVLPDLIVREGI